MNIVVIMKSLVNVAKKKEQFVSRFEVINGIAVNIGTAVIEEKFRKYLEHAMLNFIQTKSFILKSAFSCLVLFLSTAVFAGGETPVSEGLRYITNAMYGATGIAIATIAVMVVGLLCLSHFLKWSVLGYTIIGISIIFGAGSIVNGITSLIHN